MNNNKRQNDGRKYNKRKGRVKIIKNEGQVSKPKITKAKKDRAKQLVTKGNKKYIWAVKMQYGMRSQKQQKMGVISTLEMLMNYSYGKSGENRYRNQDLNINHQ